MTEIEQLRAFAQEIMDHWPENDVFVLGMRARLNLKKVQCVL